jgi:hypothetical protein
VWSRQDSRSALTLALVLRFLARLAAFFVVWIALDGDGIDLAEPTAEVDLLAAATAKGHGVASSGVELLFADGATDHV